MKKQSITPRVWYRLNLHCLLAWMASPLRLLSSLPRVQRNPDRATLKLLPVVADRVSRDSTWQRATDKEVKREDH